jgi:hypothetical protein
MRPIRGGGRVPGLALRVGQFTEAPCLLRQIPADFRLAFGSRVIGTPAAFSVASATFAASAPSAIVRTTSFHGRVAGRAPILL